MICCHKSFTKRKNERKNVEKKEEEKDKIQFVTNTPMLAN
jgi:hypothetical protein